VVTALEVLCQAVVMVMADSDHTPAPTADDSSSNSTNNSTNNSSPAGPRSLVVDRDFEWWQLTAQNLQPLLEGLSKTAPAHQHWKVRRAFVTI
jgi:hypothetical protein